jgi:hypothetical protein
MDECLWENPYLERERVNRSGVLVAKTKRCRGVCNIKKKAAAAKMLGRSLSFFFTHICALAGIPVAVGMAIRGNPTCFSSLQALARMQTYSNHFQPGSLVRFSP